MHHIFVGWNPLLIPRYICGTTICVLIAIISTEYKSRVGVLSQLSSRIDISPLWLLEVPPFYYCCISYISRQMDATSIRPSMGLCILSFHHLVGFSSLVSRTCNFSYLTLWQNPTLEYYTAYKASDLKTIVHALQSLQLNNGNWPLHAIRAKYQRDKVRNMERCWQLLLDFNCIP